MAAKNGKEFPGKEFQVRLLRWNKEQNIRQMPWKGEKNPYRVWLSEVILQQTRVEQGLKYYDNFITTYPRIEDLAKAPDEKIFKLWEGLGYYSRCRNLIATARFIAFEKQGKFPDTYNDIMSLKGIGPYTAAAISSFAYNLPHAVVDGNVFRVLARVFGIDMPIDSTTGKKYFTQLADELLDKKQPGIYNQAIMDFGAVICKPVSPLCSSCVFNQSCSAFLHKKVNELPVRGKQISIKKRWFYYLVIEYKDQVIIRQRTGKDIWQQLYEFPMVETGQEQPGQKILAESEKTGWLKKDEYEIITISPLFKQQLSHQLIAGRFITISLKNKTTLQKGQWVKRSSLVNYTFPRVINHYFEQRKEQALF